jgi:hypothetical protein
MLPNLQVYNGLHTELTWAFVVTLPAVVAFRQPSERRRKSPPPRSNSTKWLNPQGTSRELIAQGPTAKQVNGHPAAILGHKYFLHGEGAQCPLTLWGKEPRSQNDGAPIASFREQATSVVAGNAHRAELLASQRGHRPVSASNGVRGANLEKHPPKPPQVWHSSKFPV